MRGLHAQLKRYGLTLVHEEKVKRTALMYRLFLAAYNSHATAVENAQKLRQLGADAFVVREKGKYSIYAGSYLHEEKAAAEQRRLLGRGVKLSMHSARMTLLLNRVTAGSFPSSKAARIEAARLQKRGLTAKVIKGGC